jgi:hypothetical protein
MFPNVVLCFRIVLASSLGIDPSGGPMVRAKAVGSLSRLISRFLGVSFCWTGVKSRSRRRECVNTDANMGKVRCNHRAMRTVNFRERRTDMLLTIGYYAIDEGLICSQRKD